MSAKSAYQRWHEWKLRVVSDSNQHENIKQRQREQKRKERAKFKEEASNTQLEAKRAADRQRQRRRRARLRAAKEMEAASGTGPVVDAGSINPRVVQQMTNKGREHSHSKSSRPQMKISVTGLISAKKGNRIPDKNIAAPTKGLHSWDNLNGHGNQQFHGRMEAKVKDVKQKRPVARNTRFLGDLLVPKNNNLLSFSSPLGPNTQQIPEQDQPLCLKTVPRLAKTIDRDYKRTLISPSEHLKKVNSSSPDSWNTDLSGRKRSRKQSVPLKYVALH
ncbi:uncharacterized protein LOC129254728 [Lytechinus pictus]|uniref:uncharacterized protein LOC129254728 n=1 Tax=Lytechinus pictus TaxID=7653 RepID=UPI0030BA15AF